MDCQQILVERSGHARTLTLNRPDRLDAWMQVMETEFRRAVDAAAPVFESSLRSLGVMKSQVCDALLQDLDAAWRPADTEMLASSGCDDFCEGVAHCVEWRAPAFTGR